MPAVTDQGMAMVLRLPIGGHRDRTNASFEDSDSRLLARLRHAGSFDGSPQSCYRFSKT